MTTTDPIFIFWESCDDDVDHFGSYMKLKPCSSITCNVGNELDKHVKKEKQFKLLFSILYQTCTEERSRVRIMPMKMFKVLKQLSCLIYISNIMYRPSNKTVSLRKMITILVSSMYQILCINQAICMFFQEKLYHIYL